MRPFWFLMMAAVACSPAAPGQLPPPSPTCEAQCKANGTQAMHKYCGTDGRTYDGCDWACSASSKTVRVYPGACAMDGTPPVGGPPVPADGDDICDWVQIEGEWFAVGCAEDLVLPAALMHDPDELGTAVGPTTSPAGGTAPPVMTGDIDHKNRFLGVRNQGPVSSCTAFAGVAALEAAVASATGEKLALSEAHLWARYHKPQVLDFVNAAQRAGLVTTETANAMGLPYDPMTALAWENGSTTPDATKVAALDQAGLFEVSTIAPLPMDSMTMKPNVALVKEGIAKGFDLWLGLSVADEFMKVDRSGVVKDYAGSAQAMGHAVLAMGVRTINGTPYVAVRNSYGPNWGDNGYGYLSEKTLQDNLRVAVAIAVRRNSKVMVQNCPEGQAAGLDGTCRMRCMDGSLASASGQCSDVPVSCPAGQTADATNVCVAACNEGSSNGMGYSVECTTQNYT